MQHHRSNLPALDYDVDDATQIDAEPHWSTRRASLARMPTPAQMPPLPRPRAVGTMPPPLRAPMRVHHTTERVAPLPPPVRAPAFYSFAEQAAAQHLDTERVAPLPMSDLEGPWIDKLARAWQRFAAPACGLIAGLILVVGYLASSTQRAPTATATTPAPAVVMPAEVAAIEPTPVEALAAVAPPAADVDAAPPTARPSRVAPKRVAAKKRVASTTSRGKRRPITIDASTPLGQLRPGRSF